VALVSDLLVNPTLWEGMRGYWLDGRAPSPVESNDAIARQAPGTVTMPILDVVIQPDRLDPRVGSVVFRVEAPPIDLKTPWTVLRGLALVYFGRVYAVVWFDGFTINAGDGETDRDFRLDIVRGEKV